MRGRVREGGAATESVGRRWRLRDDIIGAVNALRGIVRASAVSHVPVIADTMMGLK